MQPAAAFFGVKSEYFFRAASDIEFCVFPRLDSSRGVSDKPQTMSGLSGAPSGTASQTISNRANRTRCHLLLKTGQMTTQTAASRGYVLFSGATKGHTKKS